ncbi:MAG: peptidoglycan-binding domain-containing protein [Alphaproteobacteria bacterium]
MKKILTIMLLSTALPAAAMAQSLSVKTGDAQISADTAVENPTPSEVNAAEKMEAEIKSGDEPVLNTTVTTDTALEAPSATDMAPDADANPITDATVETKTETEIKAAETPAAAPMEATVPQDASTAVTTETTTDAAPAAETPAVAADAETKTETSAAVKTRANLSRANVRKLQKALKDQGSYTGNIDGSWGDQTAAAVSDFQSKNSLGITGELDQATIDKLGVDFSASAIKRTRATKSKVDMNDPANKALESRVVPKADMNMGAGAAVTTQGAVTIAPATTPAPAEQPAAAPAPVPAPAADPVMAPTGSPPEGNADENSGYSTTY